MCARWIGKKGIPQHLITKLDAMKHVDSNGSVSFSDGFVYADYRTVLFSNIQTHESVPDYLKLHMVTKALSLAAGRGKITDNSILNEVNRLETEYLNQGLAKYTLVTSISIKSTDTLKRRHFKGCLIDFRPKIKGLLDKERKKIELQSKNAFHAPLPSLYSTLCVYVQARNPLEAGEVALDSLNTIRAIWNLFYNVQYSTGMRSGKAEPFNKILLGPLHTVHSENGRYQQHFVESKYVISTSLKDIESDISKFMKFEAWTRRRLKTGPVEDWVYKSLIRYVLALDEWDYEAAFMKLWSLMEYLTHTTDYDLLIKRVKNRLKEPNLHNDIMQHLRKCRNDLVHFSLMPEYIDTLLYQVKRYAENLLNFYIDDSCYFKNQDEILNFLDLSNDKRVLEEKRKLIKLKLKALK